MAKPVRKYFSKIRKWMRFSGLTLYREIDNCEKLCLWIFPLALYVYWATVNTVKWDLSGKIEEAMYSLGLLAAAPFITTARIHRGHFAKLLDLLEDVDVWGKKGRDEHLDALSVLIARVGDRAGPLALVLFSMVITTWFISTNGSGLPFASMPEWTVNLVGYTGCFLCQVIVYCGVSHEYIMINAVKVCVMIHLRMHFKHLGMNVKNIVENAKEDYCKERGALQNEVENCDIPWKYLHAQLKGALTYHESLIRISKEIETLFNKCILFSFISVSLFICVALYLLVECSIFSFVFLRLIFYSVMAYVPFFIDCYLSKLVTMESVEIAYSCYQINFIGTDLRFQKMIVMLIKRWQNAVKFTIGKFAPLEIATSVAVAKASISYFMLLQNLKKANH